ncbi:MAG: BACON domain-containing protein, partial [Dehalococcoidia bacterium]|nr:BACON domain-containing protein [Dehalococcoidia bacterium]
LFTATVGGSNPLDREFAVWNEGDGTLEWEVSDDAVWLSLSPLSGSSTGGEDEVTVSVDTSGLVVDTYSATITITCADASNSPRLVTVTLDVDEASTGAEIVFVPDSFEFDAEENGSDPDDQILELWNAGPDSLDWEVESDEDWLDVSPDSGTSSGEHDGVTLSVDIDDLDEGDYEATITVSWDGGDDTIDVSLDLGADTSLEDPEIDFSPSDFEFEAVEGGDDPDEVTLKIWNDGDGDMDWEVESDEDWLSLSPDDGTSSGEKDSVDVSVDIDDLDAGEYEATITIRSGDADNSPERLDVTLTIEESDEEGGSAEGFYQLYATTTPAMGGSISRSVLPQAAGYPADTSVTLTAVPAMGYAFTGWTGDGAGATNP